MGSSTSVRVGVIGCGFFARNHLNAWQDLKSRGIELTAVCDLDRDRVDAIADEFKVPNRYTSADEMLGSGKLDLVDIVTQVRSHRQLAEAAIGAGIGTIVQKPFALTIEDCETLTRLAADRGVFLAVHENFRFQMPNRLVHDTIRSGAIGEPNWARISFRTGYDIYAGQPYLMREKKFVVADLGAHVLDLARVFLGEVEHVSAELQRRNPAVAGEDTATMMLRHKSGAVSVVECTYESGRRPDVFPETMVEVEGSEGAICVRANMQIDLTSKGELTFLNGDVKVLPWAERPWHVVQESVLRTCEHIVSRFVESMPADVSGADNLKTFALCEAAYEAAETKMPVRPAY